MMGGRKAFEQRLSSCVEIRGENIDMIQEGVLQSGF